MTITRRGLLALSLASMAAPVFIPRERIHVAPIVGGFDVATGPDSTAWGLFMASIPAGQWVVINDEQRRLLRACGRDGTKAFKSNTWVATRGAWAPDFAISDWEHKPC